MNTIGHFINGEMIADTERTQAVYNPATGEAEKQVALASVATVEEASDVQVQTIT
jgi:malonate-semialdehyde dehydrogenase (acetylating)/methylmalonate-semialdehyde dehydrogenase